MPRRFYNLSLRWKLIAITTGISVAALLVAIAMIVVFEFYNYRNIIAADLASIAEIASINSTAAITFNDRKAAQDILHGLRAKSAVDVAAIYTKDGKLFANYLRSPEDLPPLEPGPDGIRFDGRRVVLVSPILLDNERIGTFFLDASLVHVYERLKTLAGVAALVSVAAILLAFLLSSRLQQVISRPVLNLAAVAKEVSEGKDYSARAHKEAADEIGFLIDRFNEMLEQIQQRDAALSAAHGELEQKVIERTRALQQEILDRKRAESEVRKLNDDLHQRAGQLETANRELESFSYSVSHDLRAPLRHISGFVDLLEHSIASKLDATDKEYFATIKESVREAGLLIDDLLSFSRMGRAEMQLLSVNMNDLAREVQQDVAADTNGRNIEWRIGTLPEVRGDASMLRLVLRNLFSNAIKYSRERPQALIEVHAQRSNGENIFSVHDNGIGFDMKYAERLFGVFHRLHGSQFEGTGIGLANVRRIVARHGGRTWAEGAVDKGATFYFSLPVAEKSGGT